MSGRSKRILYRVADALLFLGAALGSVLFSVFWGELGLWGWLALDCGIAAVVFGVPVLVHEIGHLLFGLLSGMQPVSFKVSLFSGDRAGQTSMFPKDAGHIRGKFLSFAIGGPALDLIAAAGLLPVGFVFSDRPFSLFCVVLGLFLAYEGVRALLPAELPAGKTDGAVIFGICKKKPEEEVALRVLEAQGILHKNKFSSIPEALFEAPVVREDLPACRALLFLRAQSYLASDEPDRALAVFDRLGEIEELSQGEAEELERYLGWFEGRFEAKKSPLLGVRELEEKLTAENYCKIGGESATK